MLELDSSMRAVAAWPARTESVDRSKRLSLSEEGFRTGVEDWVGEGNPSNKRQEWGELRTEPHYE